jgi:FkbM family methyltransferase
VECIEAVGAQRDVRIDLTFGDKERVGREIVARASNIVKPHGGHAQLLRRAKEAIVDVGVRVRVKGPTPDADGIKQHFVSTMETFSRVGSYQTNKKQMSSIYDWLAEQTTLGDKVAMECGALDFSDTRRLAAHFGTVLAFEANPAASVPTDLPSNVEVELKALSTETGTIQFFVDKNPEGNAGASSLLQSNPFYLKDYLKQEESVEVPCTTLQDALAKHNLSCAHFFWLDMEGYELEFLRGTDLSGVQFIYSEVNFQRFRKGACTYAELKAFLQTKGFVELKKWTRDETWNGDVLFGKAE